MKNIIYFKNSKEHGDIGENFHYFKMYEGGAKEVIYILGDTAKDRFKKYFDAEGDFCTFTNCTVIKGQEKIIPTENSYYTLYRYNEKGIPTVVEIQGEKIKKANKPFYKTFPGIHSDGSYIGLLISKEDVDEFKKSNKNLIEGLLSEASM